jgi:hypothetical protein
MCMEMFTDLETARSRFDAGLTSLLGMSEVLRSDLDALLEAHLDDQVLRRNAVRASWAYIEAIPYAMKGMLLTLVEAGAYPVATDEDRAFLTASRWETRCNIKSTLRLASKVFAVAERDLGGGSGWSQVKPMIDLRDRLVHPKTVIDLEVTDSEWAKHVECFKWLLNTFDGLLLDIQARYAPLA